MNDIRAVQMKPIRSNDSEYTRTVNTKLCNREGELGKLEQHDNVICLLTNCRIYPNRTTELQLNSIKEGRLFE
jgi:hypothetical protein